MRPAHVLNYHTGRPRFHFDEASDAAAAAASAAATAAAAGAAKPWHDGTDPEILGHWQNKGLDLADPAKIAIEMTKQHRAAEKHFGVPTDRLLKLPAADAKPEELAALWQRLGAPKEAKEYDFSGIKFAGNDLEPDFAEAMRAGLAAAFVPKDKAGAIVNSVVKYLESADAAEATIASGKLATERLNLEKNWGGKDSATYQFNHLKAIEGARKLGLTPEGTAALEGQIGFANIMETLRKIGVGTAEAPFHEGGSGGVTTAAGAAARLAELEGNKEWGKRFRAGDAAAAAEWRQLTALATGEG